mmetsp:Transcript_21051/g.54476  ORF Transcript_21051/g.54476 Transcript_21051/m.54476 type:complete len:203 (+) Transcript_21051:6789-7397(+)
MGVRGGTFHLCVHGGTRASHPPPRLGPTHENGRAVLDALLCPQGAERVHRRNLRASVPLACRGSVPGAELGLSGGVRECVPHHQMGVPGLDALLGSAPSMVETERERTRVDPELLGKRRGEGLSGLSGLSGCPGRFSRSSGYPALPFPLGGTPSPKHGFPTAATDVDESGTRGHRSPLSAVCDSKQKRMAGVEISCFPSFFV